LEQRLVSLRRAQHPLGLSASDARAVRTSLEQGSGAATVLAKRSRTARLARVLDEAKPADAAHVLDALVSPLSAWADANARLRAAAGYPLMLLFSTLLLLGVVDSLSSELTVLVPEKSVLPAAALLACGALLLWLFAALSSARPLFPFAAGRREVDRALVLQVASVLANAGVALDLALQSASRLTASGGLARSTRSVAEALRTAQTTARDGRLLGPLGASLLLSAATAGAGPATLSALAAHATARARAQLPWLVFRSRVLALITAGVAVALTAAAFYSGYVHAVTGG
jgi:type II secretory pathway component PulF